MDIEPLGAFVIALTVVLVGGAACLVALLGLRVALACEIAFRHIALLTVAGSIFLAILAGGGPWDGLAHPLSAHSRVASLLARAVAQWLGLIATGWVTAAVLNHEAATAAKDAREKSERLYRAWEHLRSEMEVEKDADL